MGFSLSDLNPFSAAKKVTKAVAKPFRKISRKGPKELRWMAPYLAAATPFMLPPGFQMGSLGSGMSRGIMSALANVAGQGYADPEGEDINLLSTALAGGAGYLGSEGVGDRLRSGIERSSAGPWTMEGVSQQPVGFFQGAENLGREGLATAADYLGGSAEGLASLGKNPASLFTTAGAKAAATDIAPLLVQGTGDVAKASGDKALREFEAAEAAEEAEYGANEEKMQRERMEAIRAGMEENNFSEEEIQVVFDRLGLGTYVPSESAAQGGIIGLRNGGMLNLGGNEMDYRGGGFVPIGKRERADDVPARLSKNEFVMTADAVKAAGGGSVNKGAQRMYNVMNQLEARS